MHRNNVHYPPSTPYFAAVRATGNKMHAVGSPCQLPLLTGETQFPAGRAIPYFKGGWRKTRRGDTAGFIQAGWRGVWRGTRLTSTVVGHAWLWVIRGLRSGVDICGENDSALLAEKSSLLFAAGYRTPSTPR